MESLLRLGFALGLLAVGFRHYEIPIARAGWRICRWGPDIGGAIAISLIGWSLFAAIVGMSFHLFGAKMHKFMIPGSEEETWRLIIDVMIITPVSEELVFRGLLLNVARIYYGRLASILITAFLFAGMHLFKPAMFVPLFIMGALYGFLYLWTSCILSPMLAHSCHNILIPFAVRHLWQSIPHSDAFVWSTYAVLFVMGSIWLALLLARDSVAPRSLNSSTG